VVEVLSPQIVDIHRGWAIENAGESVDSSRIESADLRGNDVHHGLLKD